jgi:hypothetical protein
MGPVAMKRWTSWTLNTPTRRARLVRILYEEAVDREADAGIVRPAGAEAPFVTFLRILDDLGLYVALDSLNAEPREWPADTLEVVPLERITRARGLDRGAASSSNAGQVHELSEGASGSRPVHHRPGR